MSQTNDSATSVLDSFFLKLGTVLSMTKDALLADFLGDLPAYAPNLQPLMDANDREGFKAALGQAGSQLTGRETLTGFVECIFRRLGYDLTSFEGNKELTDLITSIFVTAESLGESVAALAGDGITWKEVETIAKANQPAGGGNGKQGEKSKETRFLTPEDVFSTPDGKSFFSVDDGKGNSFSLEIGDLGNGKLGAIVDIAIDLFNLIKKFRDLEWSKIETEDRDFINYLNDNFFTEAFAERLFDHILVVLLSKAREVFDEEIREIAQVVGQAQDEVSLLIQEAKNAAGRTVSEILVDLNRIKEQAEELYGELLAEYRRLENELLALVKQALGPFGQLGDILERIYRVLDFFGLIGKRSIPLAKYIPSVDLAGVNEELDSITANFDKHIEDINDLIDKADKNGQTVNDEVQEHSGVNLGITPLGYRIPVTASTNFVKGKKAAEDAAAKLKARIPTVEIHVIRWSRLEQLFSSPKDYFKEVFPVHDYDDAEALVLRLIGLVRSFNPDLLDFSSLTSILNELLAALKAFLRQQAADQVEGLKDAIQQTEAFILYIKKILECYAIEYKKKIVAAFNEVAKDVQSEVDKTADLLGDLRDKIWEKVREVERSAREAQKAIIDQANVVWRDFAHAAGIDEQTQKLLYGLFAQPLEDLIVEKAAEYSLTAGVDPANWTAAIRTSFTDWKKDGNGLAAAYLKVLSDVQRRIDVALNKSTWEKAFQAMAKDLKTEFENQTKDVPGDLDELKEYGKDSITALIQGNTPGNPFSDFDITAFPTIILDHIKALLPTDLDEYYYRIKSITENGFKALVKNATGIDDALIASADAVEDDVTGRARDFTRFVTDVYAGYWPRVKEAFYKLVFRPLFALVEKVVKEWAMDVLKKLTEGVKELLKNVYVDKDLINGFLKAAGWAADAIQTAGEVAEQILLIKAEGEEVDSWQDGLALAVKIYSLIPEKVKEYVRDIVDLPKIDVDIHLPDYKLDIKNKFLAVKLYELQPSSAETLQARVEGAVSIQLLAFVGDRETGEKDEDGNPITQAGLFFYPYVKGNLKSEFNLGSTHKMGISASTALNDGFENPKKTDAETALKDGIGLFFTGDWFDSLQVIPLADAEAIQAWLELYFSRGQVHGKVDPVVIYDSNTFKIELGNYPQKAFVGYNKGFDAGYVGQLQDLKFSLDLRKENGFFEKLLSAPLSFSVDKLAVGYTYRNGLSIGGSTSIRIPINKTIDLKAAKISNLALEIGIPDFRGLDVGISTNLSLSLDCVNFSLSDLGFGLKSELLDNHWRFKDFNLTPSLKLPDGVGISVDLEGVKGAGALKWNAETGEMLGFAELAIVELFSASSLFLLNTKPKDGAKFSFMGAIFLTIEGGIPLGMGFSLTGIGGSLGLFRRIDTDRMQRAVHDGTLSSVVFVKDVEKHLDTVLENMTSFYPVSKENFFFGAMAQISWAEKVKVDMGLFIQAPDPVVIMIAGGLHFNVADEVDKLLSINANFLGIIDFSKGLSFDAALYDSYIVGIQFYGDIALRVYWAGDTKGFLLSAGGFHPQYKPEAGFNVSDMKRLGMKFEIECVKLSMEEYFAVTSNTVQFGSDSRLQVGWKEFGLSGYMYYNVLFQFRPFAFQFDAGIGVSVKCKDWTLMCIDLYLEVSGPTPWHIHGKASFWFLLVKIKCSFTAEWGKKQQVGEQSTVLVIENYSKSFENNDNWTVISSDLVDNLVILAPYSGGEIMMKSADTLRFSQEEIPLDEDMECFGESLPSVFRVDLSEVSVGVGETEKPLATVPVSTSFAPSMFKKMTEHDKLTKPSYQSMHSGFAVQGDKDAAKPSSKGIKGEVQQVTDGDLDLKAWKKAVKKFSGSTAKAKAKAGNLAFGKPTDSSALTGKVTSEKIKAYGKGAPRAFRPSARRTADGFNRYIQELNATLGNNLKEKLEV